MRCFRRWPEVGHREARVEVDAKVIHPADGEHDVQAELQRGSKSRVDGSLFEGGPYFEDFKISATRVVGREGW